MFLDHTQRRSTVGRTPLDEWSARRRDLYLTTHDTHNRQISMLRWDSNPRSQQASGLRPLTCWDLGFESHRGHGYLSVVSVVCCQVEVSATSIIHPGESYRLCCVIVCDLETSRMGAPYIYDISRLRVNRSLPTFRKDLLPHLCRLLWWNSTELQCAIYQRSVIFSGIVRMAWHTV